VLFLLAKHATLSAGRDIRDVTLMTQNVRAGDTTRLSAGRDVIYGGNAGNKQIEVGGGGRLEVLAARDVDLRLLRRHCDGGPAGQSVADHRTRRHITILAGVARL
jgi:hypothetical protein